MRLFLIIILKFSEISSYTKEGALSSFPAINGDCSIEPSTPKMQAYIFQQKVSVTMKCRHPFYPSSFQSNLNLFGLYVCKNITPGISIWESLYPFDSDTQLSCKTGCSGKLYVPELGLTSDENECTILNPKAKDKLFSSCPGKCLPGYHVRIDNGATNQVSSMMFQCVSDDYGRAKYHVPNGKNSESFMKCVKACPKYGARLGDDAYGMSLNCDDLGAMMHSSCSLSCNLDDGFYPISDEAGKDDAEVECVDEQWYPYPTGLYCTKGCRTPGSDFEGAPKAFADIMIKGTDYFSVGQLSKAAASCQKGYVVSEPGVIDGVADEINCYNGRQVTEALSIRCVLPCGITNGYHCPEGYSCTGTILKYVKRRLQTYCKKDSVSISGIHKMTRNIDHSLTNWLSFYFGDIVYDEL